MSSGRGRSPCDTGPRELRLDVICPGTLAAASRRNDGSGCTTSPADCPQNAHLPRRAALTPKCRSATRPVISLRSFGEVSLLRRVSKEL